MLKIIVAFAVLSMAACGSASQAGPKPAAPAPTVQQQPPSPEAVQGPVDLSGKLLMISGEGLAGFRMRLTPSPWRGQFSPPQPNGVRMLLLERTDLHALLAIMPYADDGTDARRLAVQARTALIAEGAIDITEIESEPFGRYAFMADGMANGQPARVYIAIVPHPTSGGIYLIFKAISSTAVSDEFLKDVRSIADSIGPLK